MGCVGSVSRVRSRRGTVTVMSVLPPAERKRLADLLGRLGSDHPGERDNAGVMAHRIIKTRGLSWPEIIDPPPPVERSLPEIRTWRSTVAKCLSHPGSLRKWEIGFLQDLPKFHGISVKQRYCSKVIADRVLGRANRGGRNERRSDSGFYATPERRAAWIPRRRISLRLVFHECGVFELNGKWWAAPASKAQISRDEMVLKEVNGKAKLRAGRHVRRQSTP
jgi:hypothetical protein